MLSAEVQQQIGQIGPVDIVIGVPSYNHAQTIAPVMEAVREGLAKYFSQARAALVNSDGGSSDGTPELLAGAGWEGPRLFVRHESPPVERVAIPFHGLPGRAAAQRAILEAASRLDARACAMIGPDCPTIGPEWIDRLLRPVLESGFDYVSPLYQRHRYDGSLTNSLIYPLTRAMFGRRVRHPLAGHNALSGRFAARLGAPEVWRADTARGGIDILTIAIAGAEGFRVCEGWLGPCKTESRGRTADLAGTFAQAMESVFAVLERTADIWTEVRGSEPVPAFGAELPLGVEPLELNVNRMVRGFKLGLKDLLPLWEQVLSPETLAEVLALGPAPDEALRFPHDLWASVVYDFALGYHFRILHREHLLRSLVPFYLGRTGAFVRETSAGGARGTEGWIERGCVAFERQKRYLVERWR